MLILKCSGFLSVAVIKYTSEMQLGEKGVYFILHFQVTVHHDGHQGWNPSQGPEADAMEDSVYELILRPTLCQLCSCRPGPRPRDGAAQSGLGPPAAINNHYTYPDRQAHRLDK